MYSVQVGAFSNAAHAISLKTLLDAKGYAADIEEPRSIREGRLYRVCIGKLSNRDSAKILSEKIEATEGIKAFVIPLEEVSR
jgi:cell division septation protein DedD